MSSHISTHILMNYAHEFYYNPTSDKLEVFSKLFQEYMSLTSSGSSSFDLFNFMVHDINYFRDLSDDVSLLVDDRATSRAVFTLINITTLFYMSTILKQSGAKDIEGLLKPCEPVFLKL